MPTLGLILAWGGYWFLTYGLALRKGANVNLLQMAAPSQRAVTLDAMRQVWGSSPQPKQGSSGGVGKKATVPIFPGLPAFGPTIGVPGTNTKVGL